MSNTTRCSSVGFDTSAFCRKIRFVVKKLIVYLFICMYSGHSGVRRVVRGFIVSSKGLKFYRVWVTREGFKVRGGGT